MPFTDNGGVRLHWDEQGDGTPVLLVMGASYSSAMWWPAMPALAAKHRVIRFDNRGTGQSQSTRVATIADMAADAVAVLDAAGVDRAHVYGVSLGGVVAQQLALAYPERVRSLILGCTGILSDDKPRAPKALQLLFFLPMKIRVALTRRGGYGPACPPDRAEQDQAVMADEHPKRQAVIAQQNALRAYAISREQVREHLTMPALVLHGDADTLVPHKWGQELADTLPNARMVTYEGAAHNYLVAAGETPQEDVLEFLAEVDRSLAER